VALLKGAIALLVQAAVEIEIDMLRGERHSEQDSALAVRDICDLGQDVTPQLMLGGGVIDQIEKLVGLRARNIHICSHSPEQKHFRLEIISTQSSNIEPATYRNIVTINRHRDRCLLERLLLLCAMTRLPAAFGSAAHRYRCR
jgi:hypothetical protein